MSNCDHCDHVVGRIDTATVYRCCHCGRERRERKQEQYPDSTNSSWELRANTHGPFGPMRKFKTALRGEEANG